MSNMTRIFYFDPATGSFTGQGVAEINPRTAKPLLPSNATLKPPGNAKAKWNGKKWVQRAKNKKVVSLPPVPPAAPVSSAPGDLTNERPVVDATTTKTPPVVKATVTVDETPGKVEPVKAADLIGDADDKEKTPAPEKDAKVKTVSLPGKRGKKANRP